MAEKLRRRPMPATQEQRQFDIDDAGQVLFAPTESPAHQPLVEPKRAQKKRLRPKVITWLNVRQGLANALDREAQFNAQFLWCVHCIATGCLIYFTANTEIALQPVLFGLAVFITLMTLVRQRPTLKALSVYCACIILGILLGKVETLTQPTIMLGSEVNTTISAHIIRFERLANGRKRLLLHVEKTRGPQLKYLSGKLRLTYRGDTDFEPGDYIEGRARLFPPSGPVKPGGFDFAYQAYFSDLAATGILFGAPKKLENIAPPIPLRLKARIAIERSRQAVENKIKASLSGESGDLASALVTGRKSAISDEVNESLRATGLAHILSISGLHMVLAAGSALFTVRLILAVFPAYSMAYNSRKIAAIAALGIATLYLAISGASIATQRSYIMLAIVLMALLFDRQALTMRNLAIAALLVLIVHPHEILSAGFHMSFAATAALIAVYSAVRTHKHKTNFFNTWVEVDSFLLRSVKAMITFFGGLAVTALIAGVATGLYSIYHFERFAPYGILANVVAMPIVTALIMPAGLTAMLLTPFDLDFYAWKAMGLGIDYVVDVAHHIAAFTPYEGTGALPKLAIIAGTLCLLLLTSLKTRLALLAIIPSLIFMWSIQTRSLPIGYVHERGNAVGILTDDGHLALNRHRISTFVTDQWQRSLRANSLRGPFVEKKLSLPDLLEKAQLDSHDQKFLCNDEICLMAIKKSIRIATIKTYDGLTELCNHLSNQNNGAEGLPLIIYENIHAPINCEQFDAYISNAKQRAFQGSFALYEPTPKTEDGNTVTENSKTDPLFQLKYSFQTIERPWHRHRGFSRAARNIETY